MTVPFFVAFSVPWKGLIVSAVLCAFIASIAGVLPAFKIARLNIVSALGRNV
jgi:ABC-type antimicrobial peptide transport system permease subunit